MFQLKHLSCFDFVVTYFEKMQHSNKKVEEPEDLLKQELCCTREAERCGFDDIFRV